jgi:hypothetical protein
MALDQLRERLFTLFSFYRIAHPNPRLHTLAISIRPSRIGRFCRKNIVSILMRPVLFDQKAPTADLVGVCHGCLAI